MRVIVAVLMIVMVIIGIWCWLYAPCWVYGLTAAGEQPVRCLRDAGVLR